MNTFARRTAAAVALFAVPFAAVAAGSASVAYAAPRALAVVAPFTGVSAPISGVKVPTGDAIVTQALNEAPDAVSQPQATAPEVESASDLRIVPAAMKKSTKSTKKKATKKYKKKKATKRKSTKKPATTTPIAPVTSSSSIEGQIIALTNQHRAAAGCAALRTDARLAAAGVTHSADMVNRNFFGHTGSDGSTFVVRANRAGYSSPSAENIAWGYRSANDVVTAWMNSAGHRANILNCGSKAVGVGQAKKADGTPYWTQVFGRA